MKVLSAGLVGTIALVLGLLSKPARADSIALRNGTVLHGRFVSGIQGVIAFSANGSTQYYDVRNISMMTFEGEEDDTQGTPPAKTIPKAPGASALTPQYQGTRRKVGKPAVKLLRQDTHTMPPTPSPIDRAQ